VTLNQFHGQEPHETVTRCHSDTREAWPLMSQTGRDIVIGRCEARTISNWGQNISDVQTLW